MKQGFVGALIALALITVGTAAQAQGTFERIKKDLVVRIGFANEAPWSFAQSDGTIAGADYELAKTLGGPEHLKILEKYSISPNEIPIGVTTESLCKP